MPIRSRSDQLLAHMALRLADKFDFIALLGEGGGGTVVEVENRALHRREALKILTDPFLDEHSSRRFSQEARIAASLDHPRIVRIFEFGEDEGSKWYSMQLVDGPTLATLLDGGLLLDGAMLAQLACPILDALAFSHGRGVIHRDLKPANILFNMDGRPFLADYGVAKTLENPLATKTGILMGTPAYVAPEQALGEEVDPRSDLYSLGVTLYKAVAGKLPFRADNILQTLLLRMNEAPEPLARCCPSLHPDLAAWIMKAFARDRNERWASAEAMRSALVGICTREGLPWQQPLACARRFPLIRKPLPNLGPGKVASKEEGRTWPLMSALEATVDRLRPSGRRWLWASLGLASGLLALVLVARVARHGRRPPPPRPLAAASAQPRPAPPPRQPAPKAPPVAAAQAPLPVVRRAVTYPQLLGDPVSLSPAQGCGGTSVNVMLVVAEDGHVKSCKVLSTVAPACEEAARAVALRYQFKPGLDAQGLPVETTVATVVEFTDAR